MRLRKLRSAALSLLTAAVIALASCGGDAKKADTTSAEGTKGTGFRVDGTKLIDVNGNEFVMRGVNHSHCWFRQYDDTALKAISDTGANTVRLVLADGVQWSKDNSDSVKALVDKCRELKMVAVLEVHDATGRNSQEDLEKAADFWIKIKDSLAGNEDIAILNIANEWMGGTNSSDWAKGYTTVIPRLREAGIKNTIMVDCPGWGQSGKAVSDKGIEVFESDPDRNTMFSVHMYGTAGRDQNTIEKNLKGAAEHSLCICVGEFGYKHSDGDVDEAYIMKYCNDNNIGWLGWSWKGNGGGVEYLDLTEDWEGTRLTADWGDPLVNSEYGIRATSKRCSAF